MSYKSQVQPPPAASLRSEPAADRFGQWKRSRNPELAAAHMTQIRALLAGASGDRVAGTWQHVAGNTGVDAKEWAKVLQIRHEAGEHLLPIQIEFYRAALA